MLVPETLWLCAGLAGYAAGAGCAAAAAGPARDRERLVLACLAAAVLALSVAVGVRWARVGYGPLLTLYEILLSNLLSLGVVYAIAYWRVPAVRPGAPFALGALLVLGAWSLTVSPVPGRLPPTYDHPWLWGHVLSGKIFLGVLLVAASLAARALWRGAASPPPLDARAEGVLWRALGIALAAETVMLVAGAAWARDAWGRFWAWDPLETWALATWLALAALLHARLAFPLPQAAAWWGVIAVFALAVLTFLGVPFVSVAAHKGVM